MHQVWIQQPLTGPSSCFHMHLFSLCSSNVGLRGSSPLWIFDLSFGGNASSCCRDKKASYSRRVVKMQRACSSPRNV